VTDPLGAAEQLRLYGRRALEITQELVDACRANDHHRGGELCREMVNTPDLLLLVVGCLTTTIVNSGLAPPSVPEGAEELAPWEIGAVDQMEAAVEQGDFNGFAQICVDTQLRTYLNPIRDMGVEPPDAAAMASGLMRLNQQSTAILAAEALRRLLMRELNNG
jgi:hypothetical protein